MNTNENYIQNQFCNYKIALKLKELGFNEECISWYFNDKINNSIHICDILALNKYYKQEDFKNTTNTEYILAPLWQQVIDWFREKHNIYITVNCVNWRDGKQFEGYLCKVQTREMIDKGDYSKYLHLTDLYTNYEEAREQAILKAITLIQKQ